MITESIRERLCQELERQYPLRRHGDGKRTRKPAGSDERPSELSVQLQQEYFDLKEQLLAQILFQLHTLFEFRTQDAQVQNIVRNALERLYGFEETFARNGPYDVHSYVSFLFRKHWHEKTAVDAGSLLTGLHHVEQGSFFRKVPLEIASWTKRFLHIERYHRLDALEHESRLDRYRSLRSSLRSSLKRNPWHSDDLLIWLEFRLLEGSDFREKDLSIMSREISKELDEILGPEILADALPQPFIYILLKCHQFCMAETVEPLEQRRFDQLLATRQLDSILDLMRVVVHRTTKEHRLPDAGTILDQLQAQGFNIDHQGFRDPYEAQLVPLNDTERLESARLPLFLPLEQVSGNFVQDLEMSHQELMDWHQRIVKEIIQDCAAYALVMTQPLPKAHILHRLIRFASSWTLARLPWLPAEPPQNLEEEVRRLLPDHVLRQLVRPRKGYEIKSRHELNALISAEARHQWEALERIATSQRIQGYHDYTQFTRYAAFQRLLEQQGTSPTDELQDAAAAIGESIRPDWVTAISDKWGIDSRQSHPHTLESIQQYLVEEVPRDPIFHEVDKVFEAADDERIRVFSAVLHENSPVFYQLLVAYGRHRLQLPRLVAATDQIPQMVSILAPPRKTLQEAALTHLRSEFARSGIPLYRSQLQPHLLNAAEWEAYLAWETRKRIGSDVNRFVEDGDLDALRTELEKVVRRVHLPPNAIFLETVTSTLVNLLKPPETLATVPESQIQGLLPLFPQLNCAACGQATCQDFVRSMLLGRADPHQCVQLPASSLPAVLEAMEKYEPVANGGNAPIGLLDLLNDRQLWRSSPDREAFRNVLSVNVQSSRRLFLERLKDIWQSLSGKPQIFKCPDLELLYQALCRYMGHEAAERIREDERELLAQHGDERQSAEWRRIKALQNWLTLAGKSRQSRPLLQSQDPAWVAAEIYGNVFFLHQLSPRDRELVLRHRLERHQDGFSYWWNEDLLAMNLPDFSIRDWEDFSKIIKNAYWHQESSLPAGEVLATVQNELMPDRNCSRILNQLLTRWIDLEAASLERRRKKLDLLRSNSAEGVIRSVAELREAIEALVDETPIGEQRYQHGELLPVPSTIPLEDQLVLDRDRLWRRFQEDNLVFALSFSCHWDELLPAEKKALRRQAVAGDPESGNSSHHRASEDKAFFLTGWHEPLPKRAALIQALFSACIEERYREQAESKWLDHVIASSGSPRDSSNSKASIASELPIVSVRSFRLLAREYLREGKTSDGVYAALQQKLEPNPILPKTLLDDALHHVILKRQLRLLRRFSENPSATAISFEEDDPLFEAIPELKSFLDVLLERHKNVDRERLLHYLFLLAKMEGNLDALTALLREIRETSDIMEAAWLRFTQERVMEGPAPKSIPGTTLGIPLLASRLKDKEPVNRGLEEGVSRKEKRNVAAAVKELIDFIRFHVLLQLEGKGNVEQVVTDFLQSGCDLSGIEEESLRVAIKKQFEQRASLADQKIWIYTTVTARKLAAQHAELQEAEREFYRIRNEIFKDEAGRDEHYLDIASRRGVALGQIKEEMYRQLSDLLEAERMETFQKRIRQIVDQLDQKREEVLRGWITGEINRRTLFYILRQHQKRDHEPTWEDFQRFLRDHWYLPLAELRASQRPDREERIADLDTRFRSILGISLLELEAETTAVAARELQGWMSQQMESLESEISS